MTADEGITRYLRVIDWAKRRYTQRGAIITHIANCPTRYTMIERLAFRRYIKLERPGAQHH